MCGHVAVPWAAMLSSYFDVYNCVPQWIYKAVNDNNGYNEVIVAPLQLRYDEVRVYLT